MTRSYYVYILASHSRVLYTGITNDISRRLHEHRAGLHPDSFAHAHQAFRLVLLERCGDVRDAIRREKQIKGWTRRKKLALIEAGNPGWEDLSRGWRLSP